MDQENNICNTENTPGNSGESPMPSETVVTGGSSSGVNLLLGLLPLSCLIVQIPLANILAPLVAWLCVRKDNPASKPAFRGVMNMQISWSLYCLASLFVMVVIGFILSFCVFAGMKDSPCSIKMTKVTTCCEAMPEIAQGTENKKPEKEEKIEKHEGNGKIEFSTHSPHMWLRLGQTEGMALPFPGGEIKFHSDSMKGKETRCEMQGFPAGIFGVFAMQIVMLGVMGLFFVGGVVWLIMTILFAVKVKGDANAKPPLSIRFLR